MSYIGNQVTSVPHIVDVFSGNASSVTFGQLVRAPAGTASIAVFVSGVYKTPGFDYTLNGDYITFTAAPASGINNIVIHHLGNGTTTQVPSDGSVTGEKLAINSVSGNNITVGAISGNQIGTGAISANNFAGGGITSNVLASNLQISTSRVAETVNVVTTAVGGNYDIHIANSSVYYFVANTTANVTLNIRANTQNILDSILSTGQTASLAVALKQGSTRYRANVFIDSVRANGTYWLGNSQPLYQTSQPESIDLYNFTIIKTAANTYTVMAANSTFNQANGQGMGATNGSVY